MPGLKSVTHVSDTSVTYVSGLYSGEGLSRGDWFDRFPSTPIPAFPLKGKGGRATFQARVPASPHYLLIAR